jgi:hypothetical protein
MTEKITLVYDTDFKAPACVLIQAAFDCDARNPSFEQFNAKHWLVSITPGMRKIEGTPEEWAMAAQITEEKWGNLSPNLKK